VVVGLLLGARILPVPAEISRKIHWLDASRFDGADDVI